MKTFQKVFTAMSLAAVIGLVGCAEKKTEAPVAKTGTETHGGPSAGHGGAGGHGGAASHNQGATPGKTTETMKTQEPNKVQPTLPSNDTKQPSTNDAESGSTENKGGVKLPNEAESGSTENKGGVKIPE